ncbi:MAG: succinylglutamate desuccinylase/aspartoacylase family protein [Gemmatimonadales bacterium]
MSVSPSAVGNAHQVPRVIAEWGAATAQPTLLAIGSLHGNEPAGVRALERVARKLAEHRPAFRGRFVALSGNRAALATGQRYLAADLNRCWTPETIARLRRGAPADDEPAELHEAAELLAAIERCRGEGVTYVLDLHTASGASAPFAVLADTLANRRFARLLGLPIILGLEEQLDGTLLSYLETLGFVTSGCEGGRHADPAAIDHLEAATWLALAGAGILAPAELQAEVERARALNQAAGRALPAVSEIRYRHAIAPENEFRMEPGFQSFQAVAAGQLVGHERSGPIVAPFGGRIMLPLYQSQGSDGFFLSRPVNPLWLEISALLRRARLGRLAHLLPGVSRDPERPDVLLVDRRTARWLALEVFHLLGYRRERVEGDLLVVTRRNEAS